MKNSLEVCVKFDLKGRHYVPCIDLEQALEMVIQR